MKIVVRNWIRQYEGGEGVEDESVDTMNEGFDIYPTLVIVRM